MKRPLRIAFVTVEDANDKRSWSGIPYHLAAELRAQGHEVIMLGPLRPQPVLFLLRLFNQIGLKLLGRRFHYRDSFILSRAYARSLGKRLTGLQADLILAPAGLSAIALLRTSIPIVHFNDRSIAGALEYHAVLKDLWDFSRRQSIALEQRALRNAALTVYTSEWAASAARRTCPEAADRIKVIPMGANLDRVPPPPGPRSFPPDRIELLLIGVDWVNKGGPIAFEALQELKRRGHRARLIVCGCEVPATFTDPDLLREGFLRKSIPAEKELLERHLSEAHFFVLPTRFEAYGIAFCEAAAYGLPALGTRTGGVPTIVVDGETGFLFDPEARGSAYADRIEELLRDPVRWQRVREAARKRYEDVLTWEAFVRAFMVQVEAVGLVSSAR